MFRLAEYEEGSDLFKYLSSISSKTIYDALCDWVRTPDDLRELYFINFELMPAGIRDVDFFEGIAEHLRTSESGAALKMKFTGWFSEWASTEELSADGAAAIEFLWRKIERMKEKMLDREEYYTFDLFEEYLFSMMITHMSFIDPEPGASSESARKRDAAIVNTKKELVGKYGMEEREAAWTAFTVHRAGTMDIDAAEDMGYESLFFWDDDYSLFFESCDTFIEGIRNIVSGMGAILGYDYKSAEEIFKDAGYRVPLWIIGTEASYEVRKEDAMKRLQQFDSLLPPLDLLQELEDDTDEDVDEFDGGGNDYPDLPDWSDEELPFS